MSTKNVLKIPIFNGQEGEIIDILEDIILVDEIKHYMKLIFVDNDREIYHDEKGKKYSTKPCDDIKGGLICRFGEKVNLFPLFQREKSKDTLDIKDLKISDDNNNDEDEDPEISVSILRHSWALTVEKSQGSEWSVVILVLPGRFVPFLTRERLYVSLTRAKDYFVVISDKEILYKMGQNLSDRGQNNLTEKLRFLLNDNKNG